MEDKNAMALPRQFVLRLAITMLIYTLCRVVFYVYNRDLLGVDSWDTMLTLFIGGLRFDLSGVLYVNLLANALTLLPLPWRYRSGYQRAVTIIYWVCNILAFLANMGDIVYYRFTGRRTTLQVFDEFANESAFKFLSFFGLYWQITLVGLLLITLWIYLYRFTALKRTAPISFGWAYYLKATAYLVVLGTCIVFGMRGTLIGANRPIGPAHVAHYIARPEQGPMVLNTPFVMVRTADKLGLRSRTYMSEEQAIRLFNPEKRISRGAYAGSMQGRNVVIIIWESFAREWVGALNKDIKDYRGFTPFVDSLLTRSYYWEHAYAGGGKSIDAMPAILASVPRPQTHFIGSPYSGNALSSLPKALKTKGYHTAFFHNAPNGSMGFDAMAKQLGFQAYYGKTEYANDEDYDGWWGIWDEPFLQFMVREVSKLPQPFLAVEFTTTSHAPFRIPKKYEPIYPEGEHPLHRCIRYTDHALEEFFKAASKEPWYNETLFLITADHAVPGALEEYKTSEGVFRIPMILFDPQGKLQGVEAEQVVQQADVLPTLISLLGIDYPVVAFGHNMLDKEDEHFAINSLDNVYQMVRGRWVFQYDGEQVIALYDRLADRGLKDNLKDKRPDIVGELLPLMQAYLQSFTNRMINNQLTIPKE